MLFHSMVFNERIIARTFADEMTSFFSPVISFDAVETPYEDVCRWLSYDERFFPMLMCRLGFFFVVHNFFRLFCCCCCWFDVNVLLLTIKWNERLEWIWGKGGYSMTVRSQQSEEISGKIIHYVRLFERWPNSIAIVFIVWWHFQSHALFKLVYKVVANVRTQITYGVSTV